MELPALGLNLLDLVVAQLGQRLDADHLLDVVGVTARRDGHDALLHRPQQEHHRGVDLLAGLFAESLGNPLENGLDRSAGGVSQDGRKGAVRLDDDTVLCVQVDHGLQVRKDVRVVLELCRVSA